MRGQPGDLRFSLAGFPRSPDILSDQRHLCIYQSLVKAPAWRHLYPPTSKCSCLSVLFCKLRVTTNTCVSPKEKLRRHFGAYKGEESSLSSDVARRRFQSLNVADACNDEKQTKEENAMADPYFSLEKPSASVLCSALLPSLVPLL